MQAKAPKKFSLVKVSPPKKFTSLVWRTEAARVLSRLKTTAAVMLMVAPCGYGKTSLAYTWTSRQSHFLTVWLSLDEMDNQIMRLTRYLLLSFAQNEQLAHLVSDKNECDTLEAAIQLCDELLYDITQFDKNIMLVLDNFHALPEGGYAQELIAYLVAQSPKNFRFLIVTRSLSKARFAKYHLTEQLEIIDETILAFNKDEIGEYLRKRGLESFELTSDQIWTATKGWPAFVTLAVSAAESCLEDKSSFVTSASFNDMAERYVDEEIVGQLADDVVDFALIASQIQPFCASLAEAVTGLCRRDINRVMSTLVEGRLLAFPIRRGETESWFEFHPLVAMALMRRFHSYSHMTSKEVFRKAGEWLAQNGKLNLSVQYARRNQDWSFIIKLVEMHWESMGLEDNTYMLYQWGKMVPLDTLQKSPKACSILSFSAVIYGDVEFASFCDSVALAYYTDPALPFYSEAMVFRLQVCNVQGRYEEAKVALGIVLPRLDDLDFYMTHLVRQHEISLSENPDWLRFRDMVLEMLPKTYIHTHEMFVVNNYSILCLCEGYLGNFTKALDYAKKENAVPKKAQHPGRAARVNYYFAMMASAYYRGNIKEAVLYRERFDSFTQERSLPYFHTLSLVYKAIFAYLKNALDDAASLLSLSSNLSPYGLLMVPLPLDMLLQLDEAGLFDFEAFLKKSFRTDDQTFAWSRLRFVYNLLKGDKQFFPELLDATQAINKDRRLDHIHAQLLLTLYYAQCGDENASEVALGKAIEYAKPEAIIQPFLNDYAYYLPILGRMQSLLSRDSFTASLYVKMSQASSINTSMANAKHDVVLTPRENEILYQIVSGYKPEEIAQRLGISKATVRRHVANIYEKYGVHSRTQLVLNVM